MLVLFFACADPTEADVDFALAPVDLGAARAPDTGLDLSDGSALGAAFPSLMPGWEEGAQPLWDVPAAVWAIALHERVAEEGICPFVTLDGADAVYQGGCRSKHGYEWEGSARVTRDDEGGVDRERWDFDLRVIADVDEPRFDTLALTGAVARADDGDLEHVDVNLELSLLGYFEARQLPDDPRIAAWSDWRASGSAEEQAEDFRLDVAAAVGSPDGFTLAGEDLSADSRCPVEPTGEATLAARVRVEFEGAGGCDACATLVDGDVETPACAP
jgi:hypothetical protein